MAVATLPPAPILTDGPRFATFCADHVRHTKGRWAGLPLTLEPWQQAFMNEALEVDPATGLRVYSEAILGLPRKNGKSTLAAAIALYLLTFEEEPEPEVYAAAAAKDQARIIFRQTSRFVGASPDLGDKLKVRRSDIECPENGGVMRVLSSEAPLQHGLNPSGNVIDELWAHESPDLYEALTTGSGAREQPLTVAITTAGFDPETVLGTIYAASQDHPKVERPYPWLTIVRDREAGFLFYWYGLAPEADIEDRNLWREVNPASWLQDLKYLEKQRRKPTLRLSEFRRLHLGQWTSVEEPWLPAELWDACLDPGIRSSIAQGIPWERARLKPTYPMQRTKPAGAGVDMGETYDSSGVAYAQRQPFTRDDPGPEPADDVDAQEARCIVRSVGWANPFPPNDSRRADWKVPHEAVRQFLRDLKETFPEAQTTKPDAPNFPAPGPAIAYDPWHFGESAEILEGEGLNMLEFPQFASRMIPATELVYRLVRDGMLVHDGDPHLRQHVLNAVAIKTPRGIKIAKGVKSKRLIDRAVALLMAVSMAHLEPPKRYVRKPRRAVGF